MMLQYSFPLQYVRDWSIQKAGLRSCMASLRGLRLTSRAPNAASSCQHRTSLGNRHELRACFVVHSCPHQWICVICCVVGLYIYICRSEGFANTGYDIAGCVEDRAWMLWENSSVAVAAAVVAAVVAAVAHPDLENCHFSSFITESALPECADRSVSSSEYRRLPGYGKLS